MFDYISCIFDESNHMSQIQIIYIAFGFTCFLLYRVWLGVSVGLGCKERCIKKKAPWSILAAFFGIIAVIIFNIANYKKERKIYVGAKKVMIVLCVLSILTSCNSFFVYDLSQTGEFGHVLDFPISFDETAFVSFKDEKGRKVIYDKMGNSYTFSHRSELRFYDKNGEAYVVVGDCDEPFISPVRNVATGELYSRDNYVFYINDEGYLCFFENEDDLNYFEGKSEFCYVYYDDEHLYYEIGDVSWDSEGNLVFWNSEHSSITLESILKDR